MKKRLLLLLLPLLLTAASTGPPEKRAGKDYAVFFYVTKFQPGWQGLPDTKTEAEDLKFLPLLASSPTTNGGAQYQTEKPVKTLPARHKIPKWLTLRLVG